MTAKALAGMIDHSVLQPWLVEDDIARACDIAIEYGTATVCARPCDMPLVARRLGGSGVKPCTVIGFPHGDSVTKVKLYEAQCALDDGARELDMVINIGALRGGNIGYVQDEVAALAEAAHAGGAILKVILENCCLTRDEIAVATKLSCAAGADFVKTSTGYGKYGARLTDVLIMHDNVASGVRIKAAGGIRTLDTALLMVKAGCSRIGASATKAIVDEACRREAEGVALDVSDEALAEAMLAETNTDV